MAQLAIKGHPTRGKEVIEILEMLGGKKFESYNGTDINWCYTIIGGSIDWDYPSDKYKVFSLEEFLEKYPYKVGDKVTHLDYESPLEIVGMKWENDSIKYEVYTNDYGYWFSVDELQPYKEETMEGKLVCNEGNEGMSLKISQTHLRNSQIIFSTDSPDKTELVLGDNFEVQIKDNKTYIIRKQPQYPKTCK